MTNKIAPPVIAGISPFTILGGAFNILGARKKGREQAKNLKRQSRYEAQVARRLAGFERINAQIADRNREILQASLGAEALQFGETAGEILADNEVARSASGFTLDSPSFRVQRLSDRSRLERGLDLLNERFANQSQSLIYTREGHIFQANSYEEDARYALSSLSSGLSAIRSNTVLGVASAAVNTAGALGLFKDG